MSGDAKWDLYRGADLFVLPCDSESFGIVIAEALHFGVPVVTTKGAPWADLETQECGWWVDVNVRALAEAIAEATAIGDDRRREMGDRGRAFVTHAYGKNRLAERMRAVYEWIVNGGSPPPDVWPHS